MMGRLINWIPNFVLERLATLGSSAIARRFARGVAWSLVGSVASRVLALLSYVLAARLVGKAVFGELGIIQNTVAMVGALAGFGLGTTATKHVAEFRLLDPARAGRMIALFQIIAWSTGLTLGFALVLCAPWLCSSVLKTPHLTGCIQAGSLLLLLGAINGSQNGILSGFEAFKTIARITTVTSAVNFPLMLAGAYFRGLQGMIAALIFTQAVSCILNRLALWTELKRHNIRSTLRGWSREIAVLWRFSIPATMGMLLITPVTWLCAAMLVRQPNGLEQMGAFNAANHWFNALMWLPYIVDQAVLPILSERFGAKDRGETWKFLVGLTKINLWIALPLVFLGSILSPVLMGGYGKDFVREWPVMVAMLATAGLFAIQLPVGNFIAAAGRMWVGLGLNLAWSLVFVIGTWLMLDWGALGLAAARFAAYGVQGIGSLLVAIYAIRKMTGESGQDIFPAANEEDPASGSGLFAQMNKPANESLEGS